MALAQAWSPSARSLESVFKVLSNHDHPFVMVGTYALTWMGVPVHTGYVHIAYPLIIFCFLFTDITVIDNGYPCKNLTSGIYMPVISPNKGMDGGR